MAETNKLAVLLATSDEKLAKELGESGLEVLRAKDGFDAIRMAVESRLDAVVLDKTTCRLSGPAAAVWLRLNPSTNELPLIGLDSPGSEWQEAELDASIPRDEAVERLADVIKRLAGRKMSSVDRDDILEAYEIDPLSVSLDLLDIYRQRLGLASAILKIASLQHDLGDPGYTIKSILEVAGKALNTELLGLTLIHDRAHYVLVRGAGLTKVELDQLERYNLSRLSEHLGGELEIDEQRVFGRKSLAEERDGEPPESRFFGHAVTSYGEALGYLGCIYPSEDDLAKYAGLLPDLAGQIALLLVNADLIRMQDKHSEELTSILRAVVETCSTSPLSETTTKSFLLQFLLIILELCHTDKGCVVLFKQDSQEVAEVAALGCQDAEILSAPLRRGFNVEEGVLRMAPDEVITDSVASAGGKLTRLVAPLSVGESIMGGLVILGLPASQSPNLIRAVKTLASLCGFFVYNRILHQHSVRASILDHQLTMATEIQNQMLPDSPPEAPGFDIFGRSQPAKEVGGDLFDFLPCPDGRLLVAIADVSGKSIPASLLMTMTRALIAAAADGAEGPEEVLKNVNLNLARRFAQGRFVTASLVSIQEGKMLYASAGHQPLLIYSPESDDFKEIDADGIAMGILEDMDFEQIPFDLSKGSVALMFTDGLTDALNPEGQRFGMEGIQKIIRRNADSSAEELVDALFDAIHEHADGAEQFDDTTIVAIKRVNEEGPQNAYQNSQDQDNNQEEDADQEGDHNEGSEG